MNVLRLIAAFLLTLPLSACALSGGPVSGKVLEEGTDKPIEGVIVVVRWQGRVSSLVDSHGVCVHVDSTVSDNQGYYKFTQWSKPSKVGPVFDLEPVISAYKVGYGFSNQSSQKEVEYLAPFKGTSGERLKYLLNLSHGADCYSADEKPLFPLQKALYQEAKRLAVTPQDQAGVQRIKHRAAGVWKRSEISLTDSETETLIRNDNFLSEQLR